MNSLELFERAKSVLVQGGSSASRSSLVFHPYPPTIESGLGARIVDADGNSYIDWMMAFGALPLGHAHPQIVAAVTQAAARGIHFGAASLVEVELAEEIRAIVPAAEKVRFCNSGTEAVMAGIRLARGITGRRKILKFEGHYHGWADSMLVTTNAQRIATLGHRNNPVPIIDSSGIPAGAVEDTIVVPWNDVDALRRVMLDRGREIACVITEGVMANTGVIAPLEGYLHGVQSLCKSYDVLFYLDETCTGFRVAPGGCAELYGLDPDLISFGKALGQGFPLAALCGRSSIMAGLEWGKVMHYGTFNACRSLAAAALVGLREQRRDANSGFKRLTTTGNHLSDGLRDVFASQRRHPVICQNVGGLLQVFFTDAPRISDFRDYCRVVDSEKFTRFANLLRSRGIYVNPSNALHWVTSVAHSESDVEQTVRAVESCLTELR